MAKNTQNGHASPQGAAVQSPNRQADNQPPGPGPVAPSADMYDPRLLVDIVKGIGPDITRVSVFHPAARK